MNRLPMEYRNAKNVLLNSSLIVPWNIWPSLAAKVNKYLDTCKPWTLTKEEKDRERLGTVLYTALDMTRIIVGLLDPVMPKKMFEARKILVLRKRLFHFPAFLQDY